jgi:hypothetical protein
LRYRALGLCLCVWTVATFPAPLSAGTVHGGGACHNCHTMHNSQDGLAVVAGSPGGGLLKTQSASDLCLFCHADDHGTVLAADPLVPPAEIGAGNFTFLAENNINDAPDGLIAPIPGDHAGHSVVSNAYGLFPDPDFAVAPGGTFPSNELGCTSCHDPHLRGTYRLLRSTGPLVNGYIFTFPAPQAAGILIRSGQELPGSSTAYQAGWSDWCANCHGYYHDNGGPGFEHPADKKLSGNEAMAYNDYDGPANPHGGSYATAYRPEVPIEDTARTTSSTAGATVSSRVTCMSCHRAHASSAPAALRWDPNVQFLQTDGTVSGSYPIPSPYPDPAQRGLCVKCHYDDAQDHGFGSPCMQCHRNPL